MQFTKYFVLGRKPVNNYLGYNGFIGYFTLKIKRVHIFVFTKRKNSIFIKSIHLSAEEKKGRIEPTEEQIKEITEKFDTGLLPYFNIRTGEIEATPDFEELLGDEIDPNWQKIVAQAEENPHDWVTFEKFESWESYKMMESFIASVDDEKLRQELYTAIQKRKPLSSFKYVIDGAGEYRQQWFNFKETYLMNHVRRQIKRHFRALEEDED